MRPILNLRNSDPSRPVVWKEVEVLTRTTSERRKKDRQSQELQWPVASLSAPASHWRLYMLSGILVVGGCAMILWQRDYLFGIFLILSGGVLLLLKERVAPLRIVRIDQAGIWLDNDRYLYKDIRSFWIVYEAQGIKQLSIELRRWYAPIVRVPIEQVGPLAIRDILIEFIPERRQDPSFIEEVVRRLQL